MRVDHHALIELNLGCLVRRDSDVCVETSPEPLHHPWTAHLPHELTALNGPDPDGACLDLGNFPLRQRRCGQQQGDADCQGADDGMV